MDFTGMKSCGRVVVFGVTSGLLWSIAPGFLADLFSVSADVPATIVASIIAGVVTTVALAALVARVRRSFAVVLGLASLPFGAFAFGFTIALISRFLPNQTSGARVSVEPMSQGLNYAVLSVVSVFALVLFPLAVLTTLLLRVWILRGQRMNIEC